MFKKRNLVWLPDNSVNSIDLSYKKSFCKLKNYRKIEKSMIGFQSLDNEFP